MEMLTLTKQPNPLELEFISTVLEKNDVLLLSGEACVLALNPPALEIKSFIRQIDADKLGDKVNTGWSTIDDSTWINLVEHSHKNTVW